MFDGIANRNWTSMTENRGIIRHGTEWQDRNEYSTGSIKRIKQHKDREQTKNGWALWIHYSLLNWSESSIFPAPKSVRIDDRCETQSICSLSYGAYIPKEHNVLVEHVNTKCHQRIEYKATLVSHGDTSLVSRMRTYDRYCWPHVTRCVMVPFHESLECSVHQQQHGNDSILFHDVDFIPMLRIVFRVEQRGIKDDKWIQRRLPGIKDVKRICSYLVEMMAEKYQNRCADETSYHRCGQRQCCNVCRDGRPIYPSHDLSIRWKKLNSLTHFLSSCSCAFIWT